MLKTFVSSALIALCMPFIASATPKAAVEVKDAYVRAIPRSAENTAAYMTISNHEKKAVTLIKAESASAKAVELHQHLHENGVMKMVQVQAIEIPAEGSVTLEPMGYHIMLIGVVKGFEKTSSVKMKLTFSNGVTSSITLPVQKN